MDKMVEAIEKLNKFQQKHIVNWMNKLDENDKEKLINQVLDLNIEEAVDLYNNVSRKFEIGNKKIEKISATDINKLNKDEFEEYEG